MNHGTWMVALALAGCATDELTDDTAQSIGGGDTCNDLVCPGNSDLIGVVGPSELDATGILPSSRGYRLASKHMAGDRELWFDVQGASIVVTMAGGKQLTGADLIGFTLVIETPKGDRFDLWIADYFGKVPYYAGGPSTIDGYYFKYSQSERGGEGRELCPVTIDDDGKLGHWAVVWRGDRLDPVSGQIIQSNDVWPWFNISCAGEAPIKMLRARTGGAVAPASSVAQRQATLNMFTASYCGPGHGRYTRRGQPLTWSDLSGPSVIGAAASFEAIWTPDGAICLDTPRMVSREKIGCQIPTCTKSMIQNWQSFGLLLSANPPAPL